MKQSPIRVLAIVLAFLFTASLMCMNVGAAGTGEFDPPGNLVNNPGFEDGTAGWTIGEGTGLIRVGEGHSGNHAVWFGKSMGRGVISQDISINHSGEYTLSLYMGCVQDPVYPLEVKATDVDTSQLLAQKDQLPNRGEYQLQSLSFVATRGATVRISFERENDSTIIDDVCLLRTKDFIDITLRNPGFESDLLGWTADQDLIAYTTDTKARSGNKSLCISSFGLNNCILSQSFTGPEGFYTFSVWVKTEETIASHIPALRIWAVDETGHQLNPAYYFISGSHINWDNVKLENFYVPANAKSITIELYGSRTAGALYFDDVAVFTSPEPLRS